MAWRGHSCSLHTTDEANMERIGFEMDVCRLLINQVQVVGNGGSFDNGLNFTVFAGITITEGWSEDPSEIICTGDTVRVDPQRKRIDLLKRA